MSELKTLVRKLRAEVAMMKRAPKPLLAQADAYPMTAQEPDARLWVGSGDATA